MSKTVYGFKKRGNSRFVIIAPHGAKGDDKRSDLMAAKIARKLGGFLIVNSEYVRFNSRRAGKTDKVQDFNRLQWSDKYQRYLWRQSRHLPVLREFFKDVSSYCDLAEAYANDGRAVAIYIHTFKNRRIGIDIGMGMKKDARRGGLLEIDYHCGEKWTKPAIETWEAIRIEKKLSDGLARNFKMEAGIGLSYGAARKYSAVQFHKHGGRDDKAMQLEINRLLIDNSVNMNYCADIISRVLSDIFPRKYEKEAQEARYPYFSNNLIFGQSL